MPVYRGFFGAAAAFLAALAFPLAAVAANLAVNPIRVVLDGKNPSAIVTLRNTGQESRVIQTELLHWTQEDGRDIYAPTRDLLVNPPVFTLAAGQTQLIRIGLNRPQDAATELAYRLYIQEVPPPSQPGFTGLRVALRIGLPVFVSPKAALNPRIRWQASRMPDGTIRLRVSNEGNLRIHLTDVQLLEPGNPRPILARKRVHIYMLAGQMRELTLKPESAWNGDRFGLSASTDRGVVDAEIVLEDDKP